MPATTQLLLISKFEKAYLDPNGATFFRSSYDPFSNFAIESVENSFQQNPAFGGQSTCRLTNQGDVLIGAYMEITAQPLVKNDATAANDTVIGATQVGWTNSFAHALAEESQFKIGGVEMDKIYSEYWELYSEYFIPEAHKKSYHEMVGKYPGDTISTLDGNAAAVNEYILPFRYWWEKPGVGVPTAALEGIDIEITVRFRNAISMVVADVASTSLQVAPTFTAKIWVDFAFVSDDEREFLVVEAQTYLITQLMRTSSNHITWNDSTTPEFQFLLHFNLPAKELFFVAQNNADATANTSANRWFKYGYGSGINEKDWFTTALLKLNNANREEARKSLYFRNYRAGKTHTSSPQAFNYLFSFALFPEAYQPSGSMNFSKLDQAQLTLTLTQLDAGAAAITGVSRAYILKYNTFTVVSGTAGVGFSS